MKPLEATLVTGNAGKLREWQRLAPDWLKLDNVSVDLTEIQALSSSDIVRHKLHQAYDLLQSPVIVEDVSAGLDELDGLPGPFIKFFEQQLGNDALYKLAHTNFGAVVSCTIGYYDGEHELIATASVHGTAVAPRGDKGFGFDKVFQPDGSSKTFAEMTPAEKDAGSHRASALRELTRQLKQL